MPRRVLKLKNDKETKDRLLASAKQEFMEKGYMQASLRNICKNAGVTTGALYFFFQDKESLFASLVEEPLNKLYEVMNHHYEDEMLQVEDGMFSKADHSDDIEAANQIIHYMYQYFDEFQLVLTKAQGSRFEKSIDRFVEITEKHYRKIADKMSQQTGMPNMDDYLIHWVSHMHIDIFVHMLIHETSQEAALQHMRIIIQYLITGWYGMFHTPKTPDK